MAEQTPAGVNKNVAVDFVKKEMTAMNRILVALRSVPPQRGRAMLDYINGLFTAASMERINREPERPNPKID